MAVEFHALVELMGHSRIAGKVSEETLAGQVFLRVDVPQTAHSQAFTKYYSASAVYCIAPIDEAIAQALAERFTTQRPVQPYMIAAVASPQLAEKIMDDEESQLRLRRSESGSYPDGDDDEDWEFYDDADDEPDPEF